MAYHKSYAMHSFHNCSSDDSVNRNGLTKKKIPPDKSFLAAGHHLMQIFIWFLVLSFCSGDSIQISVTEDHLRVPEDSFYTFAESEQYMFFLCLGHLMLQEISFQVLLCYENLTSMMSQERYSLITIFVSFIQLYKLSS